MLANKINDNLLCRFHRAIKSKSRHFLFLKRTRYDVFVKLLILSLGQRCAAGRGIL